MRRRLAGAYHDYWRSRAAARRSQSPVRATRWDCVNPECAGQHPHAGVDYDVVPEQPRAGRNPRRDAALAAYKVR